MQIFPTKKDIEGVEVRREVIVGIQEVLKNSIIQYRNLSLQSFDLDLANDKQWFPLKNLLKFFSYVEENSGAIVLQKIGAEVAKNAKWPPTVTTARAAIESINIAYHMNHRRDGKELFDYEKGTIIEGHIGHDRLEIDHDKQTANFVCGSFYPSDFDLGMAKEVLKIFGDNFIVALSVQRDTSKPTRKKGGDTCTYKLNYKLMKLD
jgi:hypothetical protein